MDIKKIPRRDLDRQRRIFQNVALDKEDPNCKFAAKELAKINAEILRREYAQESYLEKLKEKRK